MRVPELATARLVLRGWRESDLAPLAEINADPEVMRHLGGPVGRTASDMLVGRFLQKWEEEPRFGWWAAEAVPERRLIGFVGLARPDFEDWPGPCVEIGWRLGRAWWGRGLATEAARACLDHAFRAVRLEEVLSFTTPANAPSQRVMARLGMARVEGGDFDHPLLRPGDPNRRHLLYRMRRDDWGPR